MAETLTPVVLPAEGPNSLEAWKGRIKAAEEKRDRIKGEFKWDEMIDAYLAKTKNGDPEDVAVPKEYSRVDQKAGQLFFQTPEVLLKPLDVVPADAVAKAQAVANRVVGPDGVDAETAMTEVLFDLLCPAGLMAIKIGYENVQDGTKQIQVGEEPVPQEPIMGSVLGLSEPPVVMQPVMADVPNIVWQRYFAERISPSRLLIPAEFSGFSYDKASWLGHKFTIPSLATARRMYPAIPEDFKGKADDGSDRLGREAKQQDGRGKAGEVTGYELFIKAAAFDENEKNPDAIKRLVLIDGLDEPVAYDQPTQRVTDQGKLIGMMGNPIHVGATRYVSDSAYPPSDCWESRRLVRELNKGRTQMIQQRDRNIPMRCADLGRIGGEAGLEKIRKGIVQGIIPLESANQGDPPVFEIAKSQYPRENFEFNQIIGDDIDEVWSLSRNQLGLPSAEGQSATETATVQTNAQVRLEKDRAAVLRYYARLVDKLMGLVQLYATEPDYIEWIGADGQKRLDQWDKSHLQFRFICDVKPDSAIRVDASEEKTRALKLYQMTANDPNVNRVELLNSLFTKHGLDAARIVVAQLPEKKPDPPNISYRFSGDDLDPTMPKFPLIMEILKQGGVQISDQAIRMAQAHATLQAQLMTQAGVAGGGAAAGTTGNGSPALQTEHGGPATQQTPLSKHQMDETGGMPGMRAQ